MIENATSTAVKLQWLSNARAFLEIGLPSSMYFAIRSSLVIELVELARDYEWPVVDEIRMQEDVCSCLLIFSTVETEQLKALTQAGAIPLLLNLTSSAITEVSQKATQALINIIQNGSRFRNLALGSNLLPTIQAVYFLDLPIGQMCLISKLILVLCQDLSPAMTSKYFNELLNIITKLIYQDDIEVLLTSCWALTFITCDLNDELKAIQDSKIIPRLIALISATSLPLKKILIRLIDNITMGDEQVAKLFIKLKGLNYLKEYIQDSSLKKEVIWLLSNIATTYQNSASAFFHSGIVQLWIEIFSDLDHATKIEVLGAISALTLHSNPEEKSHLMECNIIPLLQTALIEDSLELLIPALTIMRGLFQQIPVKEPLIAELDRCKAKEYIEILQKHQDRDVQRLSKSIIRKLTIRLSSDISQK
ncbi:Importin subunit alpha-1 [Trichoplax sp. H2]|nr:Importin subunit alpha-1 [Trichoplax sp. H2]|eukprot:RDD41914.1 Importin subunit alpha-1 [Trichoplax sp. H2]